MAYPTRGRPEDPEFYPSPINPAAIYAAGGPLGYHEPTLSYTSGFPGGVQAYPMAQAQPAYPVAQAQPAYATAYPSTVAYPSYMGQATAVHGVSAAQYGGYSGGLPPAQVPPQRTRPMQQPQPQRPPHQHPPNHAAGGRTHFHKPPVTQQYDVEAGGFGPQVESSFVVNAEKQMRLAFVRKVYTGA